MQVTHRYSFFSLMPATENGKWLYLLPAVAVGAIGAASIPHFALGLSIGVCQYIFSSTLCLVLEQLQLLQPPTEIDSIYTNHLRENIILVTILAPLYEELLFHGILQPLLLLMMGALFSLSFTNIFSETTTDLLLGMYLFYQSNSLRLGMLILLIAVLWINAPQIMSIAMFGANINAASLGTVCVTAILFGAIHLFNPHEFAHVQAGFATIMGITCGLLALHYGLWVPIAAHMMNNTLVMFCLFLNDEFSAQEYVTSPSMT